MNRFLKANIIASFFALTFCLFAFTWSKYVTLEDHDEAEVEGMEEDLVGRWEWMTRMLANPATGKIPEDIRSLELAYSSTLPVADGLNKFATWNGIGPWNVGGRTRALAIDKTNPDILLAGAATGGIWRSTNGGITWYHTDMSAVPTANITSIVQDPRSGKQQNWYASTGELYGGSLPGAFFSGSGVYKSTNGGHTWVKSGNVSVGLGGVSGAWSVVHRLAINTSIDTADVLFAANFDGIYRSLNAGLTWSKIKGGTGRTGYSYFTDVAITPSGVIYATFSGTGTQQGVWRSTNNGATWTNITPSWFQSTVNRMSIGLVPSNENQVYFIANTPGQGKESKTFEGKPEHNSLWKYTYVSGDGSGTGGTWEDRSANLPGGLGGFNDFISQGSYCLEISIKPDNSNMIFIGGTNLFRSTDGFTSPNNTQQIGGYGINTTLPDFKVFPNHHPDNHGVIFYPGNAKRMLSVHDGGISRTEDATASNVVWESLNHGYLTSQFYTIAQDPQSLTKLVLGGTQDNGTYLSTSADPVTAWTQPLSYDGSYAFVKPGGGEVYLSIQQGRMQRMKLDAAGIPFQFTRIDPKGVNKEDYQFINPFTPDAADFKVLYTPAGNVIWRNSDITAIPFKNQLDSNASDLNWTMLYNTRLAVTGDEITAIYSAPLQPDVLYYGSSGGKLYRLRNASDTSSVPEAIRGTNFPSAYINCIVQHPTDSSKLYVVFTNYNVLSVFETTDGGATWTPISGNLEQYPGGTGNGPSCRWFTIAPTLDSLVYFVGTSTGLYATKKIDGANTVWTRQGATSIGTNIVTMMHHRKTDGRMVVATYGAGVFEAYVQSLDPHTGIKEAVEAHATLLYPNPAYNNVSVQGIPSGETWHYRILDISGALRAEGAVMNQEEIDIDMLRPGLYIVELQGRKTRQTLRLLRQR